jgi:hypothetical protein
MAYGYGLTDTASISSAGLLDGGNIVRIFDVALASTSNAIHIIRMYNSGASGNITINEFITITSRNPIFNSNAGIKFGNGCFVLATNCTATINFIREL